MEGVDHLKARKNYWFLKVFQESRVMSNEHKRPPGGRWPDPLMGIYRDWETF